MRLPLFIARRYFFSKKSHRAINVISMISVVGVTIGTSALIIVLSVFNGFEEVILKLYNSFDPDLKIELKEGKTFATNQIDLKRLRAINGVMYVNEVIEESALAKYRDKQYIIRVKGVGDDFTKMTGLDSMIVEGKLKLHEGDKDFAVFGSGVAYNLNINPENIFNDVEIYGVRRSAGGLNDLEGSFNRQYIQPAGIFAVQQEFDERYVIVPISFARDLFEYDSLLTSLEVKLKPGADEEEIVSQIGSVTGNQFKLSNRAEQHKIISNIMKSEKWVVFAILAFILTIAIFNVVSSQTMLVIEKKRDIAVFRSMGAETSFMRKVFQIEGMFITIGGAVCGLLIGLLICYIQIRFGVITLGGTGSFVIDVYPVKLALRDFIYVMGTVCLIGYLAAWYPSRRLIRNDSRIIEEFR